MCYQIYHQQLDDVKAIDLLQEALDKYSNHFDDEAINILSELLISSRQFKNAFEVNTHTCTFTYLKYFNVKLLVL